MLRLRWFAPLFVLTLALAACAPAVPSTPFPEPPAAGDPQLAARQALAAFLGRPLEQITVVSAEAVDWPDSCLGVPRLEARCAMQITPGFRIWLEAGDRRPALVHTNQDGSGLVLVETLLTWDRQGGIAGFCDELRLTPAGELTAVPCQAAAPAVGQLADVLTEAEARQWEDWQTRFGGVVLVREDAAMADQMRVSLTFLGRGASQPDEAEQQAMLDLAQSLYQRLQP